MLRQLHRRLFTGALTVLYLVMVFAVSAQRPLITSDVFFKTYGVLDGLPNQTVNAFAEDDEGFIWIGTLNGLSKFNGETFVNFNSSSDSLSIHNDEINEILPLGEELWLGTAEGLAVMDLESETFTHYPQPNRATYSLTIESIVKIGQELWIGYESNGNLKGSIIVFSLETREYLHRVGEESGINNVHSLFLDPDDKDKLWIASTTLYSCDIPSGNIKEHPSPYNYTPLRRGTTAFVKLSEHILLVATARYGLFKYDVKADTWSEPIKYNRGESGSFFSPNYIKHIAIKDEDEIFINSYDLGLLVYNHQTDQFSRYAVADDNPFATPSYRSHKTFVDSKRRVWHGYYSNFNVVIDDLQLVSLRSTSTTGDVSIPLVTSKTVEFFSDGRHYESAGRKIRRKNIGLKDAWNYAEKDNQGNCYYIYSDRLYKKSANADQVRLVLDKSIFTTGDEQRRWFKYFSIDNQDRLWITTELGNVIIYDPKKGARIVPIKDDNIGICKGTPEASYRIAHGPTETIISHACGLLIYDEQEDVLVDINDYLDTPIWNADRWTYTIAHLQDQTYIIGSFRQGLHILDLAKGETYSVSPELDNIIISTITSTDDNIAWCVTDAGIIYYNHDEQRHQLITSQDGLPEDYLIYQNAKVIDANTLVLGSPGNLVFVNTNKVKKNKPLLEPLLTSILVNNNPVVNNAYLESPGTLKLSAQQNDIEVQFSHRTNFSSNQANYFYQMKGLSDQWIDTRNTDHARFFELNPGKYTLTVANALPDSQDYKYKEINLEITPPYYATLWFRLLMLGLFGAILFYLYANRIQQVRSKLLLEQESKEKELLQDRNDLIQQQNKELKSLNHSKDKFFSVLAHDLRAPLAAFSGLGKQLNYHIERKNFRKIELLSNHIQQSSEKLTTLVDNLLQWSLVQTGRMSYQPVELSLGEVTATVCGQLHDISLQKEIIITRDILPRAIVVADSQAIHIIIRNLISNAIKFSHKGGEIIIESSIDNDDINLSIKDHGIGISQEQIDLVAKANLKCQNLKYS